MVPLTLNRLSVRVPFEETVAQKVYAYGNSGKNSPSSLAPIDSCLDPPIGRAGFPPRLIPFAIRLNNE